MTTTKSTTTTTTRSTAPRRAAPVAPATRKTTTPAPKPTTTPKKVVKTAAPKAVVKPVAPKATPKAPAPRSRPAAPATTTVVHSNNPLPWIVALAFIMLCAMMALGAYLSRDRIFALLAPTTAPVAAPYVAPNPPQGNSPQQPPAAPTGPVANRLKYDETGCDLNLTACRIAGQSEFPAIFVRRIQSGNLTLTSGIVAIQQLAAAAGVPTQDNWSTFKADPIYATFVWCPSGTCSYPTDTAFPLMGIPALVNDQFKLAIVSAHSPQVPPASITEVSCPVGDCWSAPLQ